jgi:methylmalonyl-CoA/ethylmalonyl-CoA epimerase
MIARIDHVAVAVRDYPAARAFFEKLLGAIPCATARDDQMKYVWQSFALGDLSRIELLHATEAGSFLDPFLADRQGGVHHITMQTLDIEAAKIKLDAAGIPYFGYNEYPDAYWKELFIHPRHAFGVLIQIAEFEADEWLAPEVTMPRGKAWEVVRTDTGCTLKMAHPGGGIVERHLDRDQIDALIRDLSAMT